MNIEAQKFTIEMTNEELWNTAFDVRRSLEHTLKTHWVNHQDVWQQNEKEKLCRVKKMFLSLGRPDLYDAIFDMAKEIFTEFNKDKK